MNEQNRANTSASTEQHSCVETVSINEPGHKYSKGSPGDRMRAFKETEAGISGGVPAPRAPKVLRWQDIRTIPDVFQHRRIDQDESEQHAQSLARAIKKGPRGARQDALAPICVYWVGDGWACVDGHHRLRAYGIVNHPVPVPVRILRGVALDVAALSALRDNSKDKLRLSPRCKTEAAWRLTVQAVLSKSAIALLADVDESSVAIMRRALRAFRGAHPTVPPEGLTWVNMRFWKDGDHAPDDKDATGRAAERLLRHIGRHINSVSAQVLLRALDMHRPGLTIEVLQQHALYQQSSVGYGAIPFPVIERPFNPHF